MTTDNKTLADVQPGGRVRLGDQAERARFEAWVKNHVSSLARAADGEYASNFTHALWSAWQAALSAQPSPGATALGLPIVVDPTVPPDTFEVRQPSPGETLPPEMRLGSPDYLGYLDTEPSPGGQDAAIEAMADSLYCAETSATMDQAREQARLLLIDALPHLAARQPDTAHAAYHTGKAIGRREAELEAAARQPVGEPAYNSAGISLTACQLHEALLMAGDPELDVPFEDRSLVRIFWTETGHSGPGLYCECVDAEEEGCILLDGAAPAIGQSAQAGDLGLQLDRYDAGLLGNGGGGDVNWWQDYIRAELDRAHEFYQDQAGSQAVGK